MLDTLVDSMTEVGHYVAVLIDGNVVTFVHDSGASIAQISSTIVNSLRRNGVSLRLVDRGAVMWVTPTGSEVVQVKLWMVPNVAMLDIRSEGNTIPSHALMLENPRLGPLDAYLGRSTLIRLNLTTEHATGVLYGPMGTCIKMWESKSDIDQRLSELYPHQVYRGGEVPMPDAVEDMEPTSADDGSKELSPICVRRRTASVQSGPAAASAATGTVLVNALDRAVITEIWRDGDRFEDDDYDLT